MYAMYSIELLMVRFLGFFVHAAPLAGFEDRRGV